MDYLAVQSSLKVPKKVRPRKVTPNILDVSKDGTKATYITRIADNNIIFISKSLGEFQYGDKVKVTVEKLDEE